MGPIGATVRLTLRARGSATADLAWRRYADLDAWRTWSPQIDAVTTVGGGRTLAAGLEGVVVGALVAGRPLLRARFAVEDVDEASMTWSWRVGPTRAVLDLRPWLGRLATLRLEHGVRATLDGSATVLRLEGPAPVVLGYALPALVALRRLVA